jgi:hypothetical protein
MDCKGKPTTTLRMYGAPGVIIIDDFESYLHPYSSLLLEIKAAGRRMNCSRSPHNKRKWRKRMQALQDELIQRVAEHRLLKLLEGRP